MRPYIICHMVISLDGRIDCAMTEHITGDEYYAALNKLNCDSMLNGRVTMEMHYAEKERFVPKNNTKVSKSVTHKAEDAKGYTICCDTNGVLKWKSNVVDKKPLICILSENTTNEYLEYLKNLKISYIVTGKNKIDLKKAMEILHKEFNVKRLVVTGGGAINGAFLGEGLLDEVSWMMAPGIDGRQGWAAGFDGMPNVDRPPYKLKLISFEKVDNDVLWARYEFKK